MAGDEGNDWSAAVGLLDKPPKRGRHGVAEPTAEALHEGEARRRSSRFRYEAAGKKKQLTSGIVRLGLHDLVTAGCEGLLGIAQHHPGMPGYDIVADLMRFVPAMFEDGQILIEQDPFLIGEIQSLEAESAHGVAQDRRALEYLKAGDPYARERLTQKAVVSSAVVTAIKLQQLPDEAQVDRRLGGPKSS